ncbi:MAG: hypothetical protein H7062_24005, partial [Candidatus Saccharimonas sp.]|nr:hypothetical protein [Planctomycetaceae bacterium]
RQTVAADLSVGVAASNLCHWGNAAYRTARELRLPGDAGTRAAIESHV